MKVMLAIAGLLALMTAGCGHPQNSFDNGWKPRSDFKFIVPVRSIEAPVKTRDC